MEPIREEELVKAEEGIIATGEVTRFDISDSVVDERDEVEWDGKEPLHLNNNVILYRMKPTRWIFPEQDSIIGAILPTEDSLKWAIYESNGVLVDIMKLLNWHTGCKKEFMRWCGKFGLENDIAIARDTMVDKAESIVNRALDVDDVESAKFVLRTAGKKRGWNEKTDDNMDTRNVYNFISVVGGGRDEDVGKLSTPDLIKYLEAQING